MNRRNFFRGGGLSLFVPVLFLGCGVETNSETLIYYTTPDDANGTPDVMGLPVGRFATLRVVALAVKNLDENHLFTDPGEDWFTQQNRMYLISTYEEGAGGQVLISEETCFIDISVVGGIDTVPGPSLLPHLLPISMVGGIEADHFTTEAYPDIWGAKLSAPLTEPLPSAESDSTQWDQDDDGQPGVTIDLVVDDLGTLFARTYVAQRVVFSLEGRILSDDAMEGHVVVESAGQNLLGAEQFYVQGSEPEVRPVEDGSLSYFMSVRIGETFLCSDLSKESVRNTLFKK